MRRYWLLVVGICAISGCSGEAPRIDTSSQEAFSESVEAVRNSLSEEKKIEFNVAFGQILVSQVKGIADNPTAVQKGNSTDLSPKLFEELNGLTADEVIAKAAALEK